MNLKEIYDSHNHNGISKQVFYKRIREGMDPFEALQYVSNRQKNILKLFKEHENPNRLSYQYVIKQVKLGRKFDDIMQDKIQTRENGGKKKIYKDLNLKMSYGYFLKLYNKGLSLDRILEIDRNHNSKDLNFELFKQHENKYNLSYRTVQHRLESGKSFEEAMSYPSGISKFQKFKNGWVMFEGEWTNIDNLKMIFDKETTENMIKSGVKVEKLFTKIER